MADNNQAEIQPPFDAILMEQFMRFMRRMFPQLPLHPNAHQVEDQPVLGQWLGRQPEIPAVPPAALNNVLPNGNNHQAFIPNQPAAGPVEPPAPQNQVVPYGNNRNGNGRRRRRRRNNGQGQQQPLPQVAVRGAEVPNNERRYNEGAGGRYNNGRDVAERGTGGPRGGRGRVTKYINKYYFIQR